MVASVRVNVGAAEKEALVKAELEVSAQYWPSNPVPWPVAALLTKEALARPLLTAPNSAAMACTRVLFCKTNGPV